MDTSVPRQLIGSEIHGFRTMEDLDIQTMMEEAKSRWLRPNEIHAVLCNYKYFSVRVKPVNLPQSGTVVLFDRKVLRNFRKDGHNWKKKKDGKTVKEAHEHLKVGDEERIHVYYAHGEDNPTFVRRCYWLLDKTLDHIVLVHYRETQESKGSPAPPVYSSPSSSQSDPSVSGPVSEESDSVVDPAYYTSQRAELQVNHSMTIGNHIMRLHEINTLEWDELLVPDDPNKLVRAQQGKTSFEQQNQDDMNGYRVSEGSLSANRLPAQESLPGQVAINNSITFDMPDEVCFQASGGQMISDPQQKDYGLLTAVTSDAVNDGLQSQDSFGKWMSAIISDTPESGDNSNLESSISTVHDPFTSPPMNHNQSSVLGPIFSIIDLSPASAFSSEETKILVVGFFREGQQHMAKSNIHFVCGSARVPAEVIQPGVFRCSISPQTPGIVDLYLSFDGHKPISQIMTFEFRAPLAQNWVVSSEDKFNLEEFRVQMRLAHLLFSKSKILNVISSKVSPNTLKEAKKFARKASHISDGWVQLMNSVEDSKLSFPQAKDNLFELTLQNRLQEWLLERVIEGCATFERDAQGQGVIHLCAILGYTWAVYPFAWSGLSLDYRDKFGWTALHWAAYYGREEMVATLLSGGAKSYLVSDPTATDPEGCTAADLASKNGHDGLAAYLAEKALVEHFKDMKLAGNAAGSLQITTNDNAIPGNCSEEELNLKDTLAAYRIAADAASRIQASFREHSLKLRTKAVQSSNPEIDAIDIIAAMKIQHAYRNYEQRKKMVAAARIQHRFRTWKLRQEFIKMRRHAIKIQAAFRGYQVRRQYKKIVWSVGVLEKAILRWRLKRKGFRGLQVNPDEVIKDQKQESDAEEDFFRASRKQAEERVERSVVKVQALFRSKRAQEEYRRMKLAHNKATAEYEVFQDPDIDMG